MHERMQFYQHEIEIHNSSYNQTPVSTAVADVTFATSAFTEYFTFDGITEYTIEKYINVETVQQ